MGYHLTPETEKALYPEKFLTGEALPLFSFHPNGFFLDEAAILPKSLLKKMSQAVNAMIKKSKKK